MMRLTFGAGEMCLVPRHFETWVRTDDLHYLYLSVGISDAALAAACDGTRGDVELRRVKSLVDARVGALAAAVNAERVAGFPSGRLFLDSIEQALAVALVNGYALRHRSVQTYRGGLGSARLRRIKEFVHAKIEDDLTLCEMAQSVELSTAYFSRMFRKSTGETPHQFLLRQRIERAKEILRSADARVMANSILRRSSVTCVELARQTIAKNFWATKRRALGKPALRIRQAFAHPGLRRNCDRRSAARKFIISPNQLTFVAHRSLHPHLCVVRASGRWPPDENLCHSLR
jgi:AraC family transcriptional regulator